MYSLQDVFGISGEELARQDRFDPQTPPHRPIATAAESRLEPPLNASQAILDPRGSAIFWLLAAGVLGLILITGQLKVEAALGGRAGR